MPTWDPMLRPKTARGKQWWDPVDDPSDAKPYGTAYWSNGKKVTEGLRGDDSRLIMDQALKFVRGQAKAGKSFFAVVWFHAPHLPVVAGPEYTKRYAGLPKFTQHYYGCITALDEQVGRLRKTLRDLGAAENTMVWYCSDNGPEGSSKSPGSAGKLRGRKRDLYEGGVRVPGLLEWPAKVAKPAVTDVPASTSDTLPTILDVLGIEKADARPIDGVSLLPLIEGRMKERPRPIAFESKNQIALTGNRYKILSRNGGKTWMLFDLVKDLSETTDLSGRHPEIVEEMAATLAAWRKSCRESKSGKDYR